MFRNLSKQKITGIIKMGDTSIHFDNGVISRKNGPAMTSPIHQEWIVNGKHHRDNGPAIMYKEHPAPRGEEAIASGGKNICEWYVDGKYTYQAVVSDEVFDRHWHKEGKV